MISRDWQDARIVLYCVDPTELGDAGSLRTVDYRGFLKGVASARQMQYGNLALPVLATRSGGLVLNTGSDLLKLLATPLKDVEANYALSLEASRSKNPDEYHLLEVKVNKPGLSARTRSGYYAQP